LISSKEAVVNDTKRVNKVLETVAWGGLFVWWGISLIPRFLPNGLDALGTGVILLGVNLFRAGKRIPLNGFSLSAGILCSVWGGLDLSTSVFGLPHRLPVFAILMIVLGVIVLVGGVLRSLKAAGRIGEGTEPAAT